VPLFLLIISGVNVQSQNVTIIESQSYGHSTDVEWEQLANSMGMNATILQQSALYDTSFFATTDALIISSGVIPLTASQISSIIQFMQSGKSLYLQAEYDCGTYNTNSTFESMELFQAILLK
jgi:hypothetical protein